MTQYEYYTGILKHVFLFVGATTCVTAAVIVLWLLWVFHPLCRK